jgi:hypothetical protein
MDQPRSSVSFSQRLAHIRRKTHLRTMLRLLLATAYAIGATSALTIFSAEPGADIGGGLRLLLLATSSPA